MTFYPSSELLLDPSPPRVADTLPGQLARSTARGAAAARRSDPRPFAGRPRGGAGGFVASLALEAWNQFLMSQEPAPIQEIGIPPLPPGTVYRIRGNALVLDNLFPPGTITPTPIFSDIAVAPLGNISIRQGAAGQAVYVRVAVGTPQEVELQLSTGVGGGRFSYVGIQDVSVVPITGSPDPVPGTFPYPTTPAGDVYPENVPINITLPQLPGTVPIITLIPVVIPRPSDLGSRPVPVLYPPGLTPDQRRALPQMWILPDGIQVGRGYSDDRVTSSTGNSVDIDIDIDLLTDYQRRQSPEVVTCTDTPEPPGDCCDCDDIRQIVIEELDSKFPPSRPNSLETTTLFPSGSGEIVLPSYSQWVEIRIIIPPPNVRTQSGGVNAPTVSFNGWVSFGATESTGERIPLHYNFASFPVPLNAQGFSWTIYEGGTAEVTVGFLSES